MSRLLTGECRDGVLGKAAFTLTGNGGDAHCAHVFDIIRSSTKHMSRFQTIHFSTPNGTAHIIYSLLYFASLVRRVLASYFS